MSYLSSNRTVNDVLKAVKRQFGDEAAIQITDEDIIRWINAGQDEIFRRVEPIKGNAQTSTIAGQAEYDLPDGILRVQSIYVDGSLVEQKSSQDFDEYLLSRGVTAGSVLGAPLMWASWAGKITFFPAPETAGTNNITLRYVATPTEAVNAGSALSVPDTYYNRLVEYVLQQAYELDENFTASDMKAAQFTSNLDASMNRDEVKPNFYPTITVLEEDL